MRLVIAFAAMIAPAICLADFTGRVVGVTDGDTITVLVDVRQVKVRLTEIDAPEKRQAWGTKARQALSDLVFGRVVTVVENGKDRYQRMLGRVLVGETDVSAEMVRSGNAWIYRKYARDKALFALEDEAREAARGLWSLPNPVPPWEFRRSASVR